MHQIHFTLKRCSEKVTVTGLTCRFSMFISFSCSAQKVISSLRKWKLPSGTFQLDSSKICLLYLGLSMIDMMAKNSISTPVGCRGHTQKGNKLKSKASICRRRSFPDVYILNFPHKYISVHQNRRERAFIARLHVVYLLHDFTGVYHITASEWDVQGGFLVMDTPDRKSCFKTAFVVHLMTHPLHRPLSTSAYCHSLWKCDKKTLTGSSNQGKGTAIMGDA